MVTPRWARLPPQVMADGLGEGGRRQVASSVREMVQQLEREHWVGVTPWLQTIGLRNMEWCGYGRGRGGIVILNPAIGGVAPSCGWHNLTGDLGG